MPLLGPPHWAPVETMVVDPDMKGGCKLVASDFANMIPALNAGKFDAVVDALAATNERKKAIDVTAPYTQLPAV